MKMTFTNTGFAGMAQDKVAAIARLGYFEGGQYTPELSQTGFKGQTVMDVPLDNVTIDHNDTVRIPVHNTTSQDVTFNEVAFFFENGDLLAIGSTTNLSLAAGTTDMLLVQVPQGINAPKRQLTDVELAEFISCTPSDLEDANEKISMLLHHIAAITPKKKVAYDVASSNMRKNSVTTGIFWSREDADAHLKSFGDLGRRSNFADRLRVERVNVVNMNGHWHKFNARPFGSIQGDSATADVSKLSRIVKVANPLDYVEDEE